MHQVPLVMGEMGRINSLHAPEARQNLRELAFGGQAGICSAVGSALLYGQDTKIKKSQGMQSIQHLFIIKTIWC